MLFFFGRTRYTILNESDERGCDAWIDRSAKHWNCELKDDLSKMSVNEKYKETDWSVNNDYRSKRR